MTTGHVRLAGVVGNVACGFDELIGTGVVSAVAAAIEQIMRKNGVFLYNKTSMFKLYLPASSFRSTIQHPLDRKIDVITLSFACNLNSICERAKRSVRPAGTYHI